MSIERMKRVWFLVPLPAAGSRSGRGSDTGESVQSLMTTLADLGLVHVEALPDPEADGLPLVRPAAADTGDVETRIASLRQILEVFDTHAPVKRGFAQNFISLPLEVSQREHDRALSETDAASVQKQALDLSEKHGLLSRRHDEIVTTLEALTPWAGAPVGAPPDLEHCVAWLGTMSGRSWQGLTDDADARDVLVARDVAGARGRTLVAAVALRENADTAGERLRRAGLEPLDLPAGTDSIDVCIAALEREQTHVAEDLAAVEKDLTDLAEEHRAAVTVCLAHWEVANETMAAAGGALRSRRIGIVSGYVKKVEVPALRAALAEKHPSVVLVDRDPAPDEKVPVSLRTLRMFAPARFLTRLFGVPDYFAFDPSPFILITFLLFFGFCFGDVIYGVIILIVASLIARRLRGYPNLNDFFTLIAWGGVASIIVGAITGAWAADLLDPDAGFVSANNILARIRAFLMQEALDPMDQPVRVLLVALAMGIANQFYGIIMLIYREIRRRDYVAAVCDGGLWLLFLPGLLMIIAAGFAPVPGWVSKTGLVLLALGAGGLVLTQGRKEKGIFAKALTGLISLYGILGTYGTTSFIGDTLSYSRLLALGLTTTIVGMSFNIVAGLVKGVPVAGIVLVVVILLIGHVFNMLVSILGAFVHSGRLVFVEFFGRFYEVGGKRFQALGTSDRVRIVGR